MLVDFSYHLQIHDWGLISLSARTSIIGFHKTEDNKY